MNRTLKITALAATAAGLLAVPAQSKPVQINPGDTNITSSPSALGTASIRIVRASSLQVAAAPSLGKICGTGRDSGELVTRAGKGSRCRTGLPLMRAWRAADNPRRFRSYRCGDVPDTQVEFRGDQRWFASWQCTRGSIAYRVWTQL
jgi:hypothetical protein